MTTLLSTEKGFGENKAVEYKGDKLTNVEDLLLALWTTCSNHSSRTMTHNGPTHKVRYADQTNTTETLKLKIRKATNRLFDALDKEPTPPFDVLEDFFVMILQVRDCRANGVGKGARFASKCLFMMAAKRWPKTTLGLLKFFPEFGCYKDLNELLVAYQTHDTEFAKQLRHQIVFLYANQLAKDSVALSNSKSISLAAKWCPKIGKACDRYCGVCIHLQAVLFPSTEEVGAVCDDPLCGEELKTLIKSHKCNFTNVKRESWYRKLLVPMMESLKVVEGKMSRKRYAEIDFGTVPGLSLKRNKHAFLNDTNATQDRVDGKKHFQEYLEKAKLGKVTTKGTSVFPHSIVEDIRSHPTWTQESPEVTLLESQWREHQENLRVALVDEDGQKSSGLVLADVSGSMEGTPMALAIAMAILVSSVSTGPWASKFLTFESEPHMIDISGQSLLDAVKAVGQAPWGGSTNLMSAFNLILNTAVAAKLPPVLLPKWLLIVSDMQFDAATDSRHNNWDTHFEALQKKFASAGTQAVGSPYPLPHVIFWNARGSSNMPIKAEDGATLLSGASPSLIKLVLGRNGKFPTAIELFREAMRHRNYQAVRSHVQEARGELTKIGSITDADRKSTDVEDAC